MTNLFIDIDGVLLGRCPNSQQIALAQQATEFLRVVLDRYDCYWLTTHCRGSAAPALEYLSRYGDDEFLDLANQIKPTHFVTFKVEALFGDYFWVDDQPTAYEQKFLQDRGWFDRWLQVDTRKNPFALVDVIEFLKDPILN